MKWHQKGFTIVELLIVIVVIGVLATIISVIFQGLRERSVALQRDADMTEFSKAIFAARAAIDKPLTYVTGRGWSEQGCSNIAPYGQNLANIEPKNLPKTHSCWVLYYTVLDQISQTSGINLSGLRDGDYNGNPYMFDENEGEHPETRCTKDVMVYYNGDGTATRTTWKDLPNSLPDC